MNPSKQHRGRKSPRRVPSLRRVSPSFGWTLLRLLCDSLSLYLPDQLASEVRHIARKRDMLSYMKLADKWSPQWTSNLLEIGAPHYAAASYLVCKLLSKTEGMEAVGSVQRRKECLDRVLQLDQTLDPHILYAPQDPVFTRAQRWVRAIMGRCPEPSELSALARHGPGSTALTSYRDRSTYFKYANWPYAVGPGCQSLFKQLIIADQRWFGSLEQDYRRRYNIEAWEILDWDAFWRSVLTPTPYNVITSVPKNGMKDRPIAKEPLGNVYCQTAVGSILKERIKRSIGIDLADQERNRKMARLASLWNHMDSYCTFDLSDASDTVSKDLVVALCDPDWVDLLLSIRSEYGLVPNSLCWKYSKMSSMGNATTFELESIIFASVILAVIDEYGIRSHREHFSVFGDDLIFPRYLSDHMRVYLRAFGFKVNESKSFQSGMFFESCGTDWLNGFNIRPIFLRRLPRDVSDIFVIHNQLQSWFVRIMGSLAPLSVSEYVLRQIDSDVESYRGPFHAGSYDGWVFSNKNPRRHEVLQKTPVPISCKDVWFRKLMHDLRVCDSETGSRFQVSREVKAKRSWRLRSDYDPLIGVYDHCGQIQDLAWPPWEEISHGPQGQP